MRPHQTSSQQRINWLVRNHKLWDGYGEHSPNWLEMEHLLLERMKKAGLFTPRTTILDVSFENLINKARLKRGGKSTRQFRFGKKNR